MAIAVAVVVVPCVLKTFHKGMKYFASKDEKGREIIIVQILLLCCLCCQGFAGFCLLLRLWGFGLGFFWAGERDCLFLLVLVWFFVCWGLVFYSVHDLTGGFSCSTDSMSVQCLRFI